MLGRTLITSLYGWRLGSDYRLICGETFDSVSNVIYGMTMCERGSKKKIKKSLNFSNCTPMWGSNLASNSQGMVIHWLRLVRPQFLMRLLIDINSKSSNDTVPKMHIKNQNNNIDVTQYVRTFNYIKTQKGRRHGFLLTSKIEWILKTNSKIVELMKEYHVKEKMDISMVLM